MTGHSHLEPPGGPEQRGGRDLRPPTGGRWAAPPPREPWLTPGRLLSLVAVVVASYGALMVVRQLRGLLVMLLVALFLSFAMEPAVQYLARRGWRRGAATGAVFVGVLLASAGIVAAMTPLVIDQISGLIRSVPRSIDELSRLASRLPLGIDWQSSPELRQEFTQLSTEIGDELRTFALGAAGNVVDIGATAFGVLAQLLAIGLVTFYLVADGPRFRQALARPLRPDRQREMLAIWELAVAKTGGYIYSRMLIAVVSAVTHALFLLLLGVPYPLPLGIWMGLMAAFVPVVGVYVGGVLLIIVAATNEPVDALWLLAFITVYQQFENYVLGPKVQAHTMDLHPAVAFVSVFVGASLLGAVGALLALPAAAITKALLSTYVRRHELIDELETVAVPAGPGEPAVTAPAPPPRPDPSPEQEART